MRPSSAVSRNRPGSAAVNRSRSGSSRPGSAAPSNNRGTGGVDTARGGGNISALGGSFYDSSSSSLSSADRVQVCVRIRPFLSRCDNSQDIVALRSSEAVIAVKGPERERVFEFDHVLDGEQQELYENVGEPMLKEAINGFNVCLFAFGNTGSGKTHSMHGPELANLGSVTSSSNENNNAGLVPRLVDDLFSQLQQRIDEDPHLSVKVTLSVIEVYMEKVRDLLSAQNQSQNQSSTSSSSSTAELKDLELQDDGARKVKVKGLSVHNVLNAERVKELLRSALSNRQVAETKSNEVSSRSHCLVQLTVTQFSESVNGHDIESVITVVDLAGSERQGRAETSGQQLEEGKKINLSLLTLGRALNALGEGRRDLVSLRDSKLTRLLGESLGGNSKTWMLATVAASSTHVTETLSTLEYATYARAIKNSGVHINQFQVSLVEATRQKLLETLKNQSEGISKQYLFNLEKFEMKERVKLAVQCVREQVVMAQEVCSLMSGKDADVDSSIRYHYFSGRNEKKVSSSSSITSSAVFPNNNKKICWIFEISREDHLLTPVRAHKIECTSLSNENKNNESEKENEINSNNNQNSTSSSRCQECGSFPSIHLALVTEAEISTPQSDSGENTESSVSGEQPHRVDLRIFSLENFYLKKDDNNNSNNVFDAAIEIVDFENSQTISAMKTELTIASKFSSSSSSSSNSAVASCTSSCNSCGFALVNVYKSLYFMAELPEKMVIKVSV